MFCAASVPSITMRDLTMKVGCVSLKRRLADFALGLDLFMIRETTNPEDTNLCEIHLGGVYKIFFKARNSCSECEFGVPCHCYTK
jgi:hypothetical protein